jgi:hypothetical protein
VTVAFGNSVAPTFASDTTTPHGAVNRSTTANGAGDICILIASSKPYSTTWSVSGDFSDTDKVVDYADGTTGMSSGTGSQRLTAWLLEAGGTLGSQTLTPSSAYSPIGRYEFHYTRSGGDGWDVGVTWGGDSSASLTSWSATMVDDPGFQAGDVVVAVASMNDDTAAPETPTLSIPGCTTSLTATRIDVGSASGNDIRVVMWEFTVDSGSSTGAATLSATVVSGDSQGPAALIRLREQTTPPSGPSVGVWNGSSVVPASVGVYDGSSVVPIAGMEVSP